MVTILDSKKGGESANIDLMVPSKSCRRVPRILPILSSLFFFSLKTHVRGRKGRGLTILGQIAAEIHLLRNDKENQHQDF
jgi:hypothetical protein